MKFYFILQYRFTNRHLKELGLNKVVAYLFSSVLFIGLSIYIFMKTDYASYIYPIVALYLVNEIGSVERNNFLQTCFNKKQFLLIRVLENLITCTPFVLFLFFKHEFLIGVSLFFLSGLMGLINRIRRNFPVIPTPFYKNPFEFIVGFRNTFWAFLILYFATFMAIKVNNPNLGVFTLLASSMVGISYYYYPESEFYIWIFSQNPHQFLISKIKMIILNCIILGLPITIAMLAFYPSKLPLLLIAQLVGILYVIAAMLGKYSAYPYELNLPQGLGLGFSFIFPPLLLVIIPIFYKFSLRKLGTLLYDRN